MLRITTASANSKRPSVEVKTGAIHSWLGIIEARCWPLTMCTKLEEAWLQYAYRARRARPRIMPVIPAGTKKTLQELSRVFNKLATELTTELSHARSEIENLRKEIHRLKSSPKSQRTSHSSKSSKGSGRATVNPQSPQRTSSTSHEKKSQGQALPKSDSEYIFPREPFNPPAPSEPSPPSNN